MKRMVDAVKKEEETITKTKRTCIICGKSAEYCMRGIEKNAYCKDCALDYFKFLNYLEKM